MLAPSPSKIKLHAIFTVLIDAQKVLHRLTIAEWQHILCAGVMEPGTIGCKSLSDMRLGKSAAKPGHTASVSKFRFTSCLCNLHSDPLN